MSEIKWIRLDVDIFASRKIMFIRKLPEGNNIALIWIMLLTIAGRCNDGGRVWLTEDMPYTSKMLADELDFDVSIIDTALSYFHKLQMIETDGNFIKISGWEEHQNADGMERIREQNRKRAAKFRAKKDLTTECNVTVTQRNTTEEEEERDQEKDIPSSSSSACAREEEKINCLKGIGKGIVRMSDEQFEDLCKRLSLDELDHYIGVIVEAEQAGHRYKRKSHYQAILDMAEKDRRVAK